MAKRSSPSDPTRLEDDETMSTSSWVVLMTILVITTIIIPIAIAFTAEQGGLSGLGIPWIDTLVALPMIPAILLGIVGIWTALRDIEMDEGNIDKQESDLTTSSPFIGDDD